MGVIAKNTEGIQTVPALSSKVRNQQSGKRVLRRSEADATCASENDDDVRRAGAKGSEGKKAVNTNKKSRDSNGLALSRYFQEMATLHVLAPEEEFSAAREIENLEMVVWETLFSYAPAVDLVLAVVEKCMENSLKEFRSLRRSATILRKTKNKSNAMKLGRSAEKCAAALHPVDVDRRFFALVFSELLRIADGVKPLKRITFSPSSKTFQSYLTRVKAAERKASRARLDFVRANLRLVVSIARRFNHGRMGLGDLIQEGNIGLMKAVERYDYRRGFRFSTYASWWIRHAISRALADKGREVRLPVHMIDTKHRLTKATRELTVKLGRSPTAEELGAAADMPVDKVEKMRTYLYDQVLSLDRPVNDEDGRTFGDMLEDPSHEQGSPVDDLTVRRLTKEVLNTLHELDRKSVV